MIKFFSNNRIIFYIINFSIILLYLYPGSLLGLIIYKSEKIQPQITPDFVISSNHFYTFALISVIGLLSVIKEKQFKILIVYLVFQVMIELNKKFHKAAINAPETEDKIQSPQFLNK